MAAAISTGVVFDPIGTMAPIVLMVVALTMLLRVVTVKV